MRRAGVLTRAAAVTDYPRPRWCAHLVTLCRFDDKRWPEPKMGPFIPCERRTANMEILEIQGHDFRDGF